MKLSVLIFIIVSIFCNEVIANLVLDGDDTVVMMESSSDESAESENIELEGESETDFISYDTSAFNTTYELLNRNMCKGVLRLIEPFLEIHSPPPELI